MLLSSEGEPRMKSNSKNFSWQSWRIVGKLFPPERQREKENCRPNISSQCSSFDCSYPRRSPSPQKIAPQIRLSFHTRISTPICHACIEATYLYTSLRIVIMETSALHQNQNYHSIGMIDFSKGQLVSTKRLVIENTLSLSLSWAMTKVNLHFSFSSNRIPFFTFSIIIVYSSNRRYLFRRDSNKRVTIFKNISPLVIRGYSSSNRLWRSFRKQSLYQEFIQNIYNIYR